MEESKVIDIQEQPVKEENIVINEIDLAILRHMLENNFISPSRVTTVYELTETIKVDLGTGLKHVSRPSIYKSVTKLNKIECIYTGAKLGKTNRYFVSGIGAELFATYSRLTQEEKESIVKAYSAVMIEDDTGDWAKLYDKVMGHNKNGNN